MNIKEEISNYLKNHEIVNVIIAGTTCSGKTTLANEIRNYFSGTYAVTIVSQDDYFKDLKEIPRTRKGYLTDSINAFHTTEFKNDVETLLKNSSVIMPKYDISSNTRISKNKIVKSGKINVMEGLHTISILGYLDNSIRIFLDTDINMCLSRRIARDTFKYGIPEDRIRQYWYDCVEPMCKEYIFPQQKLADIVLKQ